MCGSEPSSARECIPGPRWSTGKRKPEILNQRHLFFQVAMARRNHVMSNTIEGKVVVITGASSGLGEATARLLSAQGASVVLGARRVDRLQSLAGELTARGGKAFAMATDVTRRDEVKQLVDAAVQKFGRIDVMINN